MAGLSFSSKSAPKSEIQRKSFTQRLSAIFGGKEKFKIRELLKDE